MPKEHWFDTLNVALNDATARRGVLGAAGALVAALVLDPTYDVEAKKRRNKKKRRKKHKKGEARHQCGPDAHNACETVFDTPEDVQFCKDKCERCQEAGTAFCINEPDDEHPDNHATCCPRGEACCGFGGLSQCCPPDRCCEAAGFRKCLDPGQACCPHDEHGYCANGETCCPGEGCVSCDAPFVVNPANCNECACPTGQIECDGECVAGTECPDKSCPNNLPPCNGRCCAAQEWCYDDRICCREGQHVRPEVVYVPPCDSLLQELGEINYCFPDSSSVCCQGFLCYVGVTDPTDWVCCGTSEDHAHTCVPAGYRCPGVGLGLDPYPPLGTHTYGGG